MADTIGSIIQQWLRENKLEEKAQQTAVPHYWIEIVGETVARQTRVETIDKGRMYVAVESAVWRNELAMRRDEIVKKVNEYFGAELVKELVLR